MKHLLSAATIFSLTLGLSTTALCRDAIAQSQSSVREKIEVGNYEILPPAEYQFQELTNLPRSATGYIFQGPSRSDGSAGQLLILYRPILKSEPTNIDYFLNNRLNAIRDSYTGWLQSGLELVSVQGFEFHRIRWVGTHRTYRVPMQGFLYVTIYDNEVIYLSSQDLTLYQSDLSRANTAAMSFSP